VARRSDRHSDTSLTRVGRATFCFVEEFDIHQGSTSMAKEKYVVGIDYGTESGRAVVVRVRDGKLMSSAGSLSGWRH
jgi:hypothetical protein